MNNAQPYIDTLLSYPTYAEFTYIHQIRQPAIIKDSPNVIFCFYGPSAVGKDTVIDPLKEGNLVNFVRSATSRLRREGEPENAYFWLPQRKPDQALDSFITETVKEYKLVEHDFHHENLYGIPESSITEGLQKGPILIRTNYNGARSIQQYFQGKITVITVCIADKNWTALETRLRNERTDIDARIQESFECLRETEAISDFVIFNDFSENGLMSVQKEVTQFITSFLK